ncbi:transient receptor potential cation channel subfamily A member 1 isoform X2 [Megalopta genalis]|uniref:transient receptor potential cation channel subfamily A member 1 isoform X2 n=1 Tax=Megalopta genalis TaxID=115081 RepID=UPI003FD5FD30
MDIQDEDLHKLITDMVDDNIESVNNILATKFDKRLLHQIGRLHINVVHIAAWRGRMELLELFHNHGADINATDAIGRCALFYAANRGDSDMVNWLLKQGAYTENKIRVERCYRNFSDLFLAQCPIGHNLPSPECLERTALHQAVQHNHSDVVKILVEANADVNAKDERGFTPLLLAGSNDEIRKNPKEMSKYVDIVKSLVAANASTDVFRKDTGTTVLHRAAELGNAEATQILLDGGASPYHQCIRYGNTPLHTAASVGSYGVLLNILKKMYTSQVDITNHMKQTALYLAACEGHDKCAKALINHGGNLAARTDYGEAVVDVIFAHIRRPEIFLNDILDSGVQMVNKSTGENLGIIVNFNVLTPEVEKQMTVVMSLIAAASNVEQLTILQHPLLETFLCLKWSKLRMFFFTLILVHAIHVFSLTGYTIMLLQYEMPYTPLRVILTFCSSALLLHNLAQALMVPKYYLRQFEMWMSYACAIITLVISLHGVPVTENPPVEKSSTVPVHTAHSEWMLHSLSVAILLSWIQMMLIIGRLPTCGYYALMFSTVLKNFFKVLVAFIFLIVGFALSFTVVFHQNDQFSNAWLAFVKTLVMMTGEYEYEDLFPNKKGDSSPLLFTSKGHIDKLLKQAEFVSHLERLISHPIFRSSCLPARVQLFLNLRRNIPNTFHFHYHKHNSGELAANISAYQREALSLLAFKNSRNNKCLITSDENKNNDNDTELAAVLKEVLLQLQTFYSSNTMPPRYTRLSDRRHTMHRRKTMNV